MIVRDFLSGSPVLVCQEDVSMALHGLNLVRAAGIQCFTADFVSPDGRWVVVFWTVNKAGKLMTLMERTMQVIGPEHATGAVRDMADL